MGLRRPESLPQSSRYKRLHSSIVRPACESGRGLFPLPTSFRAAYSSGTGCAVATGWKQKICVHLRNLRTLPFPILWGSISSGQLRLSTFPPRVPRLRVILSECAHARRKKRSPQISQIHADLAKLPFYRLRVRQHHSVPSPVAEFVGNGKRGLPHSKTLARLPRRSSPRTSGSSRWAALAALHPPGESISPVKLG